MRKDICFQVNGIPRPKQSFKMGNGHGYTPARVKAWQDAVGWAAKETMRVFKLKPYSCDVLVELDFLLPDRRKRDLDNLSKAVLDSMNKIVWKDDNQVVDLRIQKILASQKADAGCFIRVAPINTNYKRQSSHH
jgi:crossover junction endodeoxyribonuclease RusA